MVADRRREGGKPKTGHRRSRASEEQARSLRPYSRKRRPQDTEESPEKPDWVEKGTLVVLSITFIAAMIAAAEADRLARATETALSDARLVAHQAHLDEATKEDADAITSGIQQRDTESALRVAQDQAGTAKRAAGQQYFAMMSQQRVMRGQLAELISQKNITISQSLPDIVRKDIRVQRMLVNNGQTLIYIINPDFTNNGATDAINFRAGYGFRIEPGPPRTDEICRKFPEAGLGSPSTLKRGGGLTLLALNISQQDALDALGQQKHILIGGRVSYDDIFQTKNSHHIDDFCVVAVPNDLDKDAWSMVNLNQMSP